MKADPQVQAICRMRPGTYPPRRQADAVPWAGLGAVKHGKANAEA